MELEQATTDNIIEELRRGKTRFVLAAMTCRRHARRSNRSDGAGASGHNRYTRSSWWLDEPQSQIKCRSAPIVAS